MKVDYVPTMTPSVDAEVALNEVRRIFAPDPAAEERFQKVFGGQRALESEKKLMLAILEDAFCMLQIKRCRTQRCCEEEKNPKARYDCKFHEALDWIFGKGDEWHQEDYLFTFETICEVLGFNPEYLRSGIKKFFESYPERFKRRIGKTIHRRKRADLIAV